MDYLSNAVAGLGLIIILICLFYFIQKRQYDRRQRKSYEPYAQQEYRKEPPRLNERYKQKGDQFEKYVLDLFTNDFKLINWTEDEWIYNDTKTQYNETELYPDLLLEYVPTGQKFFIEAKYRSHCEDGKINVATEEQLDRYGRYSRKIGASCFLAIGLGGKPHNPRQLSIIPLNDVYPELFYGTFKRFERHPRDKILIEDLE